jgi:hypothetical protein
MCSVGGEARASKRRGSSVPMPHGAFVVVADAEGVNRRYCARKLLEAGRWSPA